MLLAGLMYIGPAAADCQEQYFAPNDYNHQHALTRPHPELARSIKLAKAGNALEQRNLAVSYDAGYLVAACAEKAHYWYQKAAKNGDQIAQNWLERENKFEQILGGPEFAIRIEPPKKVLVETVEPVMPVVPVAPVVNATVSPPAETDLLGKYDKYQQQLNDPTSDYGKLVKVGQLLGGLLAKPLSK